MMLVTAGYWNYISNESQTIETVSVRQNNQESDLGTVRQSRIYGNI